MSPSFLARMLFVLALLEGEAHVWGQLRIPGRLVVSTDTAATAVNILGNESLFRFGLALSVLFELPVLLVLKSEKDFGAFNADQLQSLALILLRWNGQACNLYLALFGFCCMLGGYVICRSTFLPRTLGILLVTAGVGYSTYLWPPLANYLYPYNLALGVGELLLGLWLLVFGVNVERWKEQARATREFESRRASEAL